MSANWDNTIGEIIADAMDKVGKDGTITVEEAKSIETTLEVVEGMQFDKGYLSPYFVTNAETMEAKLEDAYILIYEKKISSLKDLLPVLEKVAKVGKPLLIIAEEVEGEALATLVVNKLRGTLNSLRRQGPRLRRSPQGHAARTSPSSPAASSSPKTSASSSRPSAWMTSAAPRASWWTRKTPPSSKAHGKTSDIQGRVNQIRRQIEETTSDYDREKLQERLAKLAGGVAVINVGAATETEMKEKKARVEDALHATRAAVEEGIVPGGGVALLRCSAGAGSPQAGRRRADRRADRPDAPSKSRSVPWPATPAWKARSWSRKSRSAKATMATTWRPACTRTWSRRAWSIRRRSPARPSRTRRASRACCSTTECCVTEIPEKKEPAPGGGGMGGGGMGGGMDY